MTRARGKAPSQRQLRVNEEIRHALAWTLERGEVHDPVLAATPVTLTEVRTSPDLRNATVFVVPLGGEGDVREVLEALRRAQGFLRHVLSQKIEMKYVPRLSFEADQSFDEAGRIEHILHSPEVQRDLREGDAADSDSDDEDDGA